MIKYYINRCINKILRLVHISVLYSTKKGIKYYNGLMHSTKLEGKEELFINPEKLLLGFDALNDNYTLVGKNILQSPHLDLMKALEQNKNIMETEYCKRYRRGTLDTRESVYITKKMLKFFEEKYTQQKTKIIENNYEPIQVYKINNEYYIADGKHRAALCALLKKKIKCVEISNDYLKDSFRYWIYKKMLKKRQEYTINISLFKNLESQNK